MSEMKSNKGQESATSEEPSEKFNFKLSSEELENKDNLNEFVSHLANNNFAFVRYDGSILQW